MIRLSKSVVGSREKKMLSSVIDDEYLGMGGYVRKFEGSLTDFFGGKVFVACVNSGTAALHLGLMAAGVKKDDEVLVQSLTYVATFQAISACGARPVACEIMPDTCTIDMKDALSKLTKRTKAIVPVHYASRAGDLDRVYSFAKKHGLRVIEDAAHAFGTVYKGKKIGSFGDIAAFSFDGIKNITTGEGGAVVTKDAKAAEFVRDARLLGVKKDTEKRYARRRSWVFSVTHQGYRYHMSNLFAAIGIAQFGRFENEFKPARQELALRYHDALKSLSGIELFPNDYKEIVPHIFPIKVLNGRKDGLRSYLAENGIETGTHYYPNHLLEFYGSKKGSLPVTEKVFRELLSLPLHPDISKKQQDYIVKKIEQYFKK